MVGNMLDGSRHAQVTGKSMRPAHAWPRLGLSDGRRRGMPYPTQQEAERKAIGNCVWRPPIRFKQLLMFA